MAEITNYAEIPEGHRILADIFLDDGSQQAVQKDVPSNRPQQLILLSFSSLSSRSQDQIDNLYQ